MKDPALNCEMEIADAGGGMVSLAFVLHNPGPHPTTVSYYEPFGDFTLEAAAQNGRVPILQPIASTQVMPTSETIQPGKSLRLETPYRLRFDPTAPPHGGDDLTLWTLWRDPTPVQLRATLQLEGITLKPCEAHWDPIKGK